MLADQLYETLQTEPDYLVSVMVGNNLDALNQRAQQLRLAKSPLTGDQMFDLFAQLALAGDFESIQQLISGITYEPGVLTKSNDRFFFETFSPYYKSRPVIMALNSGGDNMGPPKLDDWMADYDNAGGGNGWWSDFDWGGVIGSLGGVISIFDGWGNDGEETFTPPNPNPNPNQNPNNKDVNESFFSSENMKTYAPWVLVLALVGWLAYRGKL